MATTRPSNRYTRRAALGLLAVGASGLLAACSGANQPPPPAPAAKPTDAPRPADAAKPAAPATQPAAPAAQPAATVAQAAPAPATAAPAAQQAPAASKKLGGELRLHMRAGSEDDTLNEVLPKFTADTGITVKLENIASAEYFTKLQTLIAGGTIGDVWWCAYRNTPRFANNNVIMALDDLVKADNFDLSQYYAGAIGAATFQGKLFA